jgi:transposase
MAKPLVPDDLWHSIEPLLPAPKPRRFRFPGRQPIDDRTVLTGILFVLKTGIPWADFPGELGCCGMSLHKRLSQWQRLGVGDAIHRRLVGPAARHSKDRLLPRGGRFGQCAGRARRGENLAPARWIGAQ